jgi:hypothetical protein
MSNLLLYGVGTIGKSILKGNLTSSGRGNYSPSVSNLLKKVGDEIIQTITIMRTPLSNVLTSALNIASFGQFKKRARNLPYDKLFHLFIIIQTNKRKYILEKNAVINFKTHNGRIAPKTDIQQVNNLPSGISIIQLLTQAEKTMGKNKFYSYNARSNNCQDFIMGLFKSSGIGDQVDYDFVKQELDEIFKKSPIFNKIVNTTTAIGAVGDVLINGEGVSKKTNTWIAHVKMYASKHNISYKDAMKDIKCKASYKKGAIKGGSVTKANLKTKNNEHNPALTTIEEFEDNEDTQYVELGNTIISWMEQQPIPEGVSRNTKEFFIDTFYVALEHRHPRINSSKLRDFFQFIRQHFAEFIKNFEKTARTEDPDELVEIVKLTIINNFN